MSERARMAMMLVAGAGLLALVLAGLGDLPSVGHVHSTIDTLSTHVAPHERHVTNAVTGVNFDLRATDTVGEEYVMFAAAVGVAVLLRVVRGERSREEAATRDDESGAVASGALRAFGATLAGPVIVLSVYVVVHGPDTPGGGFQGGVVFASALLLVYVAGQSVGVGDRGLSVLDAVEAAGAAGFALVGVGGLVFASAFMENFLPLGSPGLELSGGTIALSNFAVGI